MNDLKAHLVPPRFIRSSSHRIGPINDLHAFDWYAKKDCLLIQEKGMKRLFNYPKTAYGSQVAIFGKIMTMASPVDSTMVNGMTER
jgi:hypothetical protein